MKDYYALYYCSYPLLMLVITLFIARVLYLAGRVNAGASGDPGWLNRLLVAGLCVVGVGYLAITLISSDYMTKPQQFIDMETMKLGFGLMLLGLVFTFDLLVLAVWRRGGVTRFARSSELR
ncbi:MAG TPA: hypothetical protein VL495_08235 [Edaphobacter sp.]|jgi:hypothetical protein|nr:hypothetical protein [Edaphobacter sp.]